MIINNVELPDIDVADVDIMEKYENVMGDFANKMQNMDKSKKASQIMRAECHAVFEVFNELFGNGTDRKIFGDKTNLIVCVEAIQQLKTSITKADQANSEKIKAIANLPQNRQQRRRQNNGKKNKHNNYYRPQLREKSQ